MSRCIAYCMAALVLSGCGYDEFGSAEPAGRELPAPNAPISCLRAYRDGIGHVVTEDLVVSGWVTSSDEAGNFYRSFFVQDFSGAVEVRAGFWNLYNTYQPGRRVVMRLSGLAVGSYDGATQLGPHTEPWDESVVAEFGTPYLLDEYVLRDTLFSMPGPAFFGLVGGLGPEMCGMLVEIGPLTLGRDTTLCWAPGPGTSALAFADRAGDSIYVATSPYARFAAERVPTAEMSITGILFRRGTRYVLKIRDLSDVEIY